MGAGYPGLVVEVVVEVVSVVVVVGAEAFFAIVAFVVTGAGSASAFTGECADNRDDVEA